MIPELMAAEHVSDFVLHLRFADGVEGDIDLRDELEGAVFAPLQDVAYFRRFRVDPELHTLTWPNDADFAPEFLYERLQVRT